MEKKNTIMNEKTLLSLVKVPLLLGFCLMICMVNVAFAGPDPIGEITFQSEDGTNIGLLNEETSDDGDHILGGFQTGKYVEFNFVVTSEQAGVYTFVYRVSSGGTGNIKNSISTDQGASFVVHEAVEVPSTGGWDVYETIETSIVLELVTGDDVTIRLERDGGAFNFNWMGLSEADCAATDLTAFINEGFGSVEANETFVVIDEGKTVTLSPVAADDGSGTWSWTGPNDFTAATREVTIDDISVTEIGFYNVSYSNTDCGSVSSLEYRIGFDFGVDYYQAEDYISSGGDGLSVDDPTGDVDKGVNLGSISSGDYMDYVVNISTGGSYYIEYRIANNSGTTGLYKLSTIDESGEATFVENITFDNTGGWQVWITVSTSIPLELSAGLHTFRITSVTTGTNFNWFRLVEADDDSVCEGSEVTSTVTAFDPSDVETHSGDLTIIYVEVGSSVDLEASTDATGGTWAWTGPSGFSASTAEISLSDLTVLNSGTYEATYTNDCGTINRIINVVDVSTCPPSTLNSMLTAYNSNDVETDAGDLLSVAVEVGSNIDFAPSTADTDGTWAWTGPNGFAASTAEASVSNITDAEVGRYIATYTNDCGSMSLLTYTVSILECDESTLTSILTAYDADGIETASGDLLSVAVEVGASIDFDPSTDGDNGSWAWSGPNDFTASTAPISLSDITTADAGTYTVTYTNSCGVSTSIVFEVSIADDIALGSEVSIHDLKAFPNPVIDLLTVELESDGYSQYVIYNINGAIVNQDIIDVNTRELSIDLSSLNKGMFVLKLFGIKAEHTLKLTKLQ